MKRLSVDAEDAVFAINFLKSLDLNEPTMRSRPRSFARAQGRLLHEMQISRVVAIVENYLLMRAVRARRPNLLAAVPPPNPPDPLTRRLKDAKEKFHLLVTFWRDEFGIDLKKLREWDNLNTLRHLRHVLVHRLGLWQPALDPKPALRQRILQVAANPDVYRGEVPLSEADFAEAVRLTVTIVKRLERRRLV